MPQEETAPKPSTDNYVLQVGSFREQHRAEGLLRALAEKGFDAFIEKTTVSGKSEISYRVRLGPYAELSEAQQILKEVMEESGHRAMVLPYSIGEDEGVGSQVEPSL